MPRHQPGRNVPRRAGSFGPALGLVLALILLAALARALPHLNHTLSSPASRPAPAPDLSETEALLAQAEIPALDPYARNPHIAQASTTCDLAAAPDPSVSHTVCAEAETPSQPRHAVGDHVTFWVLDLDSATSTPVSATLRHIGEQLYMWGQDGIDLDPDALQRSAAVFAENLYPTIHRHFGSEWSPGIDNDERLHVLHARLSGAAGYFASHNEYPRHLVPDSNEREMFYIDPEQAQPGTTSYDSTLAHEFQHMVHWFADGNEDAWVTEGASELAMHVCGYARDHRIAAFARQPDVALTHWEPEQVTEHYAASFLFSAYFLERYGSEAMRQLVASPLNGIAGFESVLQSRQADLSFEQLFADWAIANYLDSHLGQTASPPYAYGQLDVGVEAEQVVSSYPSLERGEVQQFGADYIELHPADHDLQLRFGGATTTTLVPNQAHSGHYQWWSNRGDNSNMTLTRQFDLSDVSEATLQAWLWYDIEEGWDYAYVEVSTDNGDTWHILPGIHARSEIPGRNGIGPGYTGISGRKGDPKAGARWVEERFDLSEHTGQAVWVRFEYVTDEAVNRPGLCIDDIQIPELGYRYDAESGDDDWVAEGFVRCDNAVPQRYIVQLLRIPEHPTGTAMRCPTLHRSEGDVDCAAASGEQITIQELGLDGQQSGSWRLPTVDGASKAVLVVSATSLARGVVAPYHYEIRAAK